MSHFTVLVIGDNYEEQLAPYDESIVADEYKDYMHERTLAHYKDLWKRRDEPPAQPKSLTEALESIPLPPTDVSNISDPGELELVEWLNQEFGEDGRFGVDEKGIYSMSIYNPNSKWDWYEVGGRWSGYFKLKPRAMDDSETLAVIGAPGVFDNQPRYDADVVRKRDIDVEWMRNEAGRLAMLHWDRAQEIIRNLPEAFSWKQMLAKHTDESGNTDVDAARQEYHAQPRVLAVSEHDTEARQERPDDILCGWGDGVEQFQVTRESYIEDARDKALPTYAYVKDGEWVAPGEMGWWGMSSDNELDRRRYAKQFNEMFDALPDDTVLTLVDCHI